MEDMEEVTRRIMSRNAKPDNSEYREPTILERLLPCRFPHRKTAQAG